MLGREPAKLAEKMKKASQKTPIGDFVCVGRYAHSQRMATHFGSKLNVPPRKHNTNKNSPC